MAESWFRCHSDLASKRVAHALAKDLRIDFVQAVGHLALLWGWFSRNTDKMPAGSLKAISDEQLEHAAQWKGKALVFASWVRVRHTGKQRKGCINDWDDYNGRLVAERERNARRQADFRRRQAELEEAQRNGRVTVTDNGRNAAYDDDNEYDVVGTKSRDHPGGPTRKREKTVNKSTKFSTSARKKTASATFSRIHKAVDS